MLGPSFAGLSLAFLAIARLCSGASNISDPEERLIKHLLDGYDKTIRPGGIVNGVKKPLQINVWFAPYRIIELDDRLETMSLLAYIIERWEDPRLTWEPDEYGGITAVDTEPANVWIPRSYFPNIQVLNREDKTEVLTVQINMSKPGTAALQVVTYALLQERCNFEMTYYPFDRQTCTICVSPTQSSLNQLLYRGDYFPIASSANGGEWDLEDVSVINDMTFGVVPLACLQLTVQRRSLYYIVNLFVPTLCISILNTIGLFASIDADKDELDFATLGQTTLLSLSVLMLTVADQTPRGSLTVSLMGMFFLAMIFQTLAAAVTAVFLRNYHNRNRMTSQPKVCPRQTSASDVAKIQTEKKWIRGCMGFHLLLISLIFTVALVVGYVHKQKPDA